MGHQESNHPLLSSLVLDRGHWRDDPDLLPRHDSLRGQSPQFLNLPSLLPPNVDRLLELLEKVVHLLLVVKLNLEPLVVVKAVLVLRK